LPERCTGALVPIQISGEEEIRISRCKHKKYEECNQDAGPGPKNVGPKGLYSAAF